jgi:hypothetical protein
MTFEGLGQEAFADFPSRSGQCPYAVSRESQDRSLADMVRGAKADLQIAGSFSLTQQALVQRELTTTNGRLLAVQFYEFEVSINRF